MQASLFLPLMFIASDPLAPKLDAYDHAHHKGTPQDGRHTHDNPFVKYSDASAEKEFAGEWVVALPNEGFRKAQFVAVRVGDVEIVLAPFRVARGKLGLQALRHGVPVHAVHV